MPALDAHIQTRPIRYALILPPQCSKRTFAKAVEDLCAQWGGVFSLVLPADKLDAHGIWGKILEVGDPDVLVCAPAAFRASAPFRETMIGENRISPHLVSKRWPITAWARRNSIDIALVVEQRRVHPDAVLLDPRCSGTYTFGDVARYGIPQRQQKWSRPIKHVSVARFRLMQRQGRTTFLSTAVSSAGRGGASRRGLDEPPILFLGDDSDLADACAFWDLRAVVGHTRVQWLSASTLDTTGLSQLRRTQVVFTWHSVAKRQLPHKTQLRTIARTLGGSDARLQPLQECLPPSDTWLDWRTSAEPVTVEGGEIILSRRSPVALPSPPTASAWAMDVALHDPSGRLSLPLRPPLHVCLNPLFHTESTTRSHWRPRVSRVGITVLVTGSRNDQLLHVAIPQFDELLAARAKEAGYRVTTSDKGNYSSKASSLLGGIGELAMLLRGALPSAVLHQFTLDGATGAKLEGGKQKRRYLTQQEITAVAWQQAAASVKRLSAKRKEDIRCQVSDLLSHLLKRGVVHHGAIFHCPSCRATEWYHASEFAETYQCQRCLEQHFCDPSPEWHYRLHESVFQACYHNMRAPVLALDALRARAKVSFAFVSEVELKRSGGGKFEVDLVACLDGCLVLGEAKSISNITAQELAKYERLAKELGVPKIVLAVSAREAPPCNTHQCSGCTEPDEALSHGQLANPANWGARERVKDLRRRLAPFGIDVETLCPKLLEDGPAWGATSETPPSSAPGLWL